MACPERQVEVAGLVMVAAEELYVTHVEGCPVCRRGRSTQPSCTQGLGLWQAWGLACSAYDLVTWGPWPDAPG